MLRNHRRSLSLENRNRGHLDIPLVLLTATLVIFGLIAVANATIDPYAGSDRSGLFGVLDRLTTNSFYWQLAWVGRRNRRHCADHAV